MDNLTDALASEAIQKFLTLNRYLRQYARQMNEHGISPREFSTLRFLLEVESATVGQVQEYLYCSASVASTLLAKLEEAGYLTRTRSTEDNRVVIVELTTAGHEVAQENPLGGIVLLRRRLPTLSRERLAVINAALTDIMELMEVNKSE
ncbi:MAG: MarR family transcriptional regulator [Caldilineaceae bacterium]